MREAVLGLLAQKNREIRERILGRRLAGRLPQDVVDARHHRHCAIELDVAARLVSAHQAKVARVLEARDHRAQLAHQLALIRGPGDVGEAGDRAEHVDRREAPLIGDGAIEHDMAVERAADGVGDRIVVIVAVDEDGEDAGDGAGPLGPGPARSSSFGRSEKTLGA